MNPKQIYELRSKIAAYIVFIIGMAALLGWIFDIPILKSGLPELVAMKVNTAICFVFVGLSLILLQARKHDGFGVIIARLCAIPVIAISSLTLVEYVFGLDIGIDQFLISELPGAALTVHLGRMALISAVGFLLIGTILLILDNKTLRGHTFFQAIVFISWLLSLGSITGYFFGASELFGQIGKFTPIALPTAIAMFSASTSILLYMMDSGVLGLFLEEGMAGIFLRNVWPLVIIVPVSLGWIEYFGEISGFFSLALGHTLVATVNICFFSLFIVWNANSMKQAALSRKSEEAASLERDLKLLELAQLKSDFISKVSHELRTPLTIVRESIAQISDGLHGEMNEEQRQTFNLTMKNVDRLTHIIGNLLEVSRMEAGELSLKLDNFDLVGAVKELVLGFASKINEKNLELKINSSIEKLVIFSDEEKILEIIANLVNNAIRFTDHGFIQVAIEDKSDTVEICVIDSGVGISDNNQKELFGEFVQFGRTEGAGERGVGLGLAIVNHLVRLMDGKISVQSGVGKGSTFSVVLPKNIKSSKPNLKI